MKQLIVRNIEDEVVRALKVRAAGHGRSMEAEHRQILRESLLGGVAVASFKKHLATLPDVGEDADFVTTRDMPRELR